MLKDTVRTVDFQFTSECCTSEDEMCKRRNGGAQNVGQYNFWEVQ